MLTTRAVGPQTLRENLPETAKESLQEAALPGNFPELELTESLLVEPIDATMRRLRQLGSE